MNIEEQRLKRNAYMREWNKKNKDKIKKNRKKRREELYNDPIEKERLLNLNRKNNKKYHDNHKDEINKRSKDRNWNFNKDSAKIKRKKYQDNHPDRISISSARKRAEKGNLEFDLDIEWFNNEFKKGCAVTGIELLPNGSKSPWTVHIDKKIPTLGYTKDNCRLTVACFNFAKSNWLDGDVIKMSQALLNNENVIKIHNDNQKLIIEQNKDLDPNWNYDENREKTKHEKRSHANVAIITIRHRSKQNNLEFDLDVEWFNNEFNKGCSVTGLMMDSNGMDSPWKTHVDRKDPNIGYIKSNCRLVCACYNFAKHYWTDEDVIKMSKSLIKLL